MMNNDTKKLTFKEKLQGDVSQIKENWNNPTKRKIRGKNALLIAGKILRGLILIGLCFVILLPIFEKLSVALRHPTDISDPQVVNCLGITCNLRY